MKKLTLWMCCVLMLAACKKQDLETQFEIEEQTLQEYVTKLGLVPEELQLATGLYYVHKKTGIGAIPQDGDTVTISYTANIINGVELPASEEFEFIMESGEVIDGLYAVLKVMREGDTGTIYMSSRNAYKNKKHASIEPFSSLLFNVHLKKVR